MRLMLVAFALLLTSISATAQSESQQTSTDNPIQAIGKGIGGIFGALTNVLNPRVAEIKKLHENGKSGEAREKMVRQSDKYLDTELKELKALLRPTLESEYGARVNQLTSEMIFRPDITILADTAIKIWELDQYTTRQSFQLEFFGVPSYDNEIKRTEWLDAYLLLLKQGIASGTTYPNTEKVWYIKKIAGSSSQLFNSCKELLTESFQQRQFEFCRLALESDAWKELEKTLVERNVRQAVIESRQLPPMKRLQQLLTTAASYNLDQSKWRELATVGSLEITYVSQREFLASRLTPKSDQIIVVKLEPNISQTSTDSSVSSEYTSGRETVPNPRYLQAQRYYQEVRQGYQNCQNQAAIDSINNPYAINVCFIWGGRLNESRDLIDSTPPTISRDLTTPYQIDISEVTVTVQDRYAFVALSETGDPIYTLTSHTREKAFKFSDGVHPADTRYRDSHFSHENDIKVFVSEKLSPYDEKALFDQLNTSAPSGAVSDLVVELQRSGPASLASNGIANNSSSQSISGGYNEILKRSIVVVHSRSGLGTGFFIAKKFLLTNQHVTSGQSLVKIEFASGEETTGMVLAQDSFLDLALIALPVEGEPLKLRFDPPQIGSEVFALGHPKGLKFSLTRGVVSAIREMKPQRGQAIANPYLQTDVAINSGNSGGPLMQGSEVVGVNTFKRAGQDTEGLGFALLSGRVAQWLKTSLPSN